MSYNYDPVLITTSTILSFQNRIYIVHLNSAVTATLTFPTVTCDGINIQISRQDNNLDSLVTLVTTSPNVFYTDSVTTTNSYTLNSAKYVDFISYNGNWYLNSSIIPVFTRGGSFVSGTCVANNSNTWVVCTGGGNNNVGVTIVTPSSEYLPSLMTVVVYNISAGATLTGKIVLGDGLPSINDIMSIPISNIPAQFSVYTTTVLVSPPIAGNQYTIQWIPDVGTSSSHKFGICSARLA